MMLKFSSPNQECQQRKENFSLTLLLKRAQITVTKILVLRNKKFSGIGRCLDKSSILHVSTFKNNELSVFQDFSIWC